MTREGKILIVGGYGVVGRRIAADLAPDFPARLLVAGRSSQRAEACATSLGHGVQGRVLDITSPASIATALEDVSTVVSCIDQPVRWLLRHAIERGLLYTDITPNLMELGRDTRYEELHRSARVSGARVVLGTGLVPGISNVMVRVVADALGGAERIETSLLLSANDVTGQASLDYFLGELTTPFHVHVAGGDRSTRP